MYVIREVLHCKPGKVRQMAEKLRQISAILKDMGQEPMRLLTDVTGEPFWTIVAEAKVEYFMGLLFQYSLSSALLGGVGRDAEYIVDHIGRQRVMRGVHRRRRTV
jgi:hypothetical protein